MFAEDLAYDDRALRELNSQPSTNRYTKQPHKLKQFIQSLDQEHNSEDEGIEDYKIGGYHPVHIGQVLLNRYVVIQKLGWGHFSTVWLCKDFKYKTYVAVKIQKSSPQYMEAAFDEVEILQKVEKHHRDPSWEGKSRDDTHVVGLLNAFVHKTIYGNHFCMVFQILRCNLLDILKRYDYEGVPLDVCQEISKQVLIGLDYLHRICGVIHTDLKPENVMVCLNDQQMKEIVQNGQLRTNQLFAERTKMIQQLMGISLTQNKSERSYKKNKKALEIQERLKNQQLSKNQKKNLKKKLRKQLKKEKQNANQSDQGSENKQQQREEEPQSIEDLFDFKKGKIKFNRGEKLTFPFKVKIADLGNACWKHHHFSSEIQTRQYRSPEVILGQSYNQTADIWSFGCMMYQMLTGDLLFQPRKNDSWGKNDDHLAQIQELIGDFDMSFILRSPKMRRYFLKNGKMKKFPRLDHYPLQTILQLKNKIQSSEAKKFAIFLQQTLIPQPEKRISAQNALKLSWLKEKLNNDYKMSEQEHDLLKIDFEQNDFKFKAKQKPKLHEDASGEDNAQYDDEVFQKHERLADIKLVDRSFTDLGYIGYCDGIDLDKLDSCKNWQFV